MTAMQRRLSRAVLIPGRRQDISQKPVLFWPECTSTVFIWKRGHLHFGVLRYVLTTLQKKQWQQRLPELYSKNSDVTSSFHDKIITVSLNQMLPHT